MDYNSQRPDLIIPEYGRHIQSMVQHAVTVEDREERNKMVRAIIKVMGQLFPYLRDIEDFNHKLWDHLYIMSDFKLDVDSPYPKPEPATLQSKPNRIPYPQTNIKYGHYGNVLENIIKEVSASVKEEDRPAASMMVANLMKRQYLNWNRDTVNDDMIIDQMREMSNGKLWLDHGTELVSTEDVVGRSKSRPSKGKPKGPKKKKKRN